jgi:hypothetical protein
LVFSARGRSEKAPTTKASRAKKSARATARKVDGLLLPSTDDAFHEETTDPLVADARNFYKVEKWTRDGTQVDSLLYAANSLGREYSSVRSSTDRGST